MKKKLFCLTAVMAFFPCAMAAPVINSINENSDPVGQYEKFEITAGLTASYTNPYDPDPAAGGLDMWAVFTSPSGVTKRVNAFYMDTNSDGNGDSWKVRFASGEAGTWSYNLFCRDSAGSLTGTPQSMEVTASALKGFIRQSASNSRYFEYEGGGSFWGIGHNSGWQYSDPYCPQCVENPPMETMQSYGENVLSFWISSPWRTPASEPERAPMENSSQGAGYYNQHSARFIDEKIERAGQYGVKLILSLWIHDTLRDGTVTCWSGGDWNRHAYSSFSAAKDFFDNSQSLSYQEKYYRYIAARWGYSPSLFMWDIAVEANGTDRWCDGGQAAVESWLAWAAAMFGRYDPFSHPVTASLSGGWDSWNTDRLWPAGYAATGVSQIHSYEWKDDMAKLPRVIARNSAYMWSLGQPGYIGEYGTGVSGNQPAGIHRASWAALCSGSSTGPMLWCDGGSFKNPDAAMLQQQQHLSQFAADIDFVNRVTEQKTVTATGPGFYGWGVGSADYAVAWIFNDSGNIGAGKYVTITAFDDGVYAVKWYNTWTGATVLDTSAAASGGAMLLPVPDTLYPDIAVKISASSMGPTSTVTPTFPTPTVTPTMTPAGTDTALYNFEDGTAMGWTTVYGEVSSLQNSEVQFYRGSRSLSAACNFTTTSGGNAGTSAPLAANLAGRTLVARVWVPAGFPAGGGGMIYIKSGDSWIWEQGAWVNFTAGAWNTLNMDVDNPAWSQPGTVDHTNVRELGVKIAPPGTFTGTYTGTIYIDSFDVSLNTPTHTYTQTGTPTRTPSFTGTPTRTVTIPPWATATFTATARPAEGIGGAYVYPSLVDLRRKQAGIYFRNLSAGCSVRVYNLGGELLCTAENGTKAEAFINFRYGRLSHTSPGIYMYVITAPDGGRKSGKFAIIR